MKKVVSLLAVLFLFAGLSFAAVSTNTYTGIADFSVSGETQFDFALKNVSGDATASQIAWTSPAAFVTGSTVAWVKSDQYAIVTATATKANFRVYMYQTNTKSEKYKAKTPRINADDTKVYSGLVESVKGEKYVPVAYSMVPSKQSSITFDGNVVTTESRSDRYFTDAADKKADGSTSNFDIEYTEIAGSYGLGRTAAGGPVFGAYDKDKKVAPWGNGVNGYGQAYMYFFGGFSYINGGEKYGTDQLHIVQMTE